MKTILTIFGATGNLMHKKLLPALVSLYHNHLLDESTKIICVSRRDYTNEEYFAHLKENTKINFEAIKPYIQYEKVSVDQIKDYQKLSEQINKISSPSTHYLFYLAVGPELFISISKGLNQVHLLSKQNKNTRIVFEKPFGTDFESAKIINQELENILDEDQIYRIDHYLGKDMIQNILVMRFANRVLENSWSSKEIESIEINVKEKETVGSRGNYYDKAGALKDMIQSHLLQILALTTMERPKDLSSTSIRERKIEVLKQTSFDATHSLFGQYDSYHDEPYILFDSTTETFVLTKAIIHNQRFKETPIYLMTGKKLDEKKAEIRIKFKKNENSLWDHLETSNELVIGISDYEGISFQMNTKSPGLDNTLNDTLLDYCHSCQKIGNNPEAYEKLLMDFIDNNQTLFTSWEEIETSWGIVDSLDTSSIKKVIYHSMDDLESMIKEVKETN